MRSWHRNLRDIGWSLEATRNEGLGPNSICSAPNLRRAPTRPEAPTTLEARKRFSDQHRPQDQKEITMPTRAEDELEIMRLLARLAQAVDDRDADAYRDCLADEVVCLVSDASPNEVWRAVPREAYARRAVESVSAFDWTHHRLCNFVIVVAGERAPRKSRRRCPDAS